MNLNVIAFKVIILKNYFSVIVELNKRYSVLLMITKLFFTTLLSLSRLFAGGFVPE